MTRHTRSLRSQIRTASVRHLSTVLIAVVLGACSGDTPTEVPDVVVTAVTVTPGVSTVTSFGTTVPLTAAATGAGGVAISGKTFTWVSSDPTVASVSSSGVVTAVADGTTTVTASTDGISGSATVTVAQAVSMVEVTPVTATITSLGDTVRFGGVAVDANGNAVAGAAATAWSSSDTLVATVDSTGLATAVAFGSATITATSGASSGTASLAVTPVLASASIAPAVGTINSIGGTTQFTASAKDALGNVVAGVAFTWVSSDTLVATVDDTGLATAVSLGAATITASADTVQASASVTVVLSGTGTGTLGVIADVVANDLGGGAFSTDFSVVLTDAIPAAVSGATVTITNTTLGVVTLLESGTPGTYIANRGSFPGGQFELDIVSGVDSIQGVTAIGPGVHAITAPLANDTVVALEPLTITWTTPTQAGEAEVETRNFTSAALPDTGAFAVPGPDNVADDTQRIRVFRSNEVDIAGGLAASRFKIKIRAEVEPVAVRPMTQTLTITGSGTGTGTVTSDVGGIDCTITAGVTGGTCSATLNDQAAVVLTSTPAAGSTFNVWSGDCAGSATCALTMDAGKTADAQFDRTPPPANLVGTWGATSVTFTPTGGGTAVDIIAGGVTLTVVLRSDFTYTTTEVDGGVTDIEDGTYTVIGGTAGVGADLTFTPTGMPADEPLLIDILTATDLQVSNTNDAFDFNDDGTETSASLVAVLVKQ